jgi:glycosyltransferase involved in cell wall biosynthesis
LFVGNLGYLPNAVGARWLCDEVVPKLGPVRVVLAGSGPTPGTEALASRPGVTVVADPPTVTPYYRAATVAVVPVRAGGGTRIKVLEAFAHGCPVVSTAAGAEGLPVTDGEHLLLADSADDFAAACRRLLADPNLGAALAQRAKSVADRFEWEPVAAGLSRLVGLVVASAAVASAGSASRATEGP